jgi:polyhydroxybutyrate depolymerase
MNKKRIVYIVLALIAVVSMCISCRTLPPLNLTERDLELSIEHDGYSREFILHLPKDHARLGRIPLVIALHGGGGTAKGMIRLTYGRFNELADLHGFLVAYPQGLKKSWNDGRDDPISFAHKNDIDDIGFLTALIQTIIEKYKADPQRVFVTGISNGGFMSIRVSRDLTDQVKAAAPVCAAIPFTTKDAHLTSPPMNILLLNGTTDPLVPYSGGYVQVLGKKRGKILSTDETIAILIKKNACPDSPVTEHLEDKDPHDGTRVIRYEYMNNETGKKVVLLKVVNGGHTWPGGWQYLGEKLVGKTSMDINACNEIWNFFRTAQ